ncbi:MAG: M48 family metallopeptidase [Clostridiales bacterium]|nr:M48 family metallopeptidase [Clostridiales bacterium]
MMQYTLIRCKRKSIAVYVKDGVVTVKAPLKTDLKVIEAFVTSKERWIANKLRVWSERQAALADILSRECFLYLGERLYPIVAERGSFSVQNNALMVTAKYFENGTVAQTEAAISALKRFYRKLANAYLSERLHEIARDLGLSYTQFALTGAKGKWGSCDSRNRIRLNWHLVLLQSDLSDYVIVHELMHTVEHNHSRAFWAGVARFYPPYKEAIACLKEVGALIELYI